MYTIGELSKIVKLSIDALRYYDEIGLLKPHRIDQTNRYRYYTSDQVGQIISIMEWKQYGFSLEEIKELLVCTDKERLQSAIASRLLQLAGEQASLERSVGQLQQKLRRLEGETEMEKKTVLIIDDAPFMRKVVKDILGKEGLTIVGEAADGETGVALYADLKPDLVIADIGLPGMDGIEVVRNIKELDRCAKIVMCSARGRLLTILSSLQAGASHFVVKAFQQQFLLEAIQHAWNRDKPYDPDTIIALINDKRICDLEQKVSHETVNALLTLCDMPQITAEGPEFAQFWSRIRHSEQPV